MEYINYCVRLTIFAKTCWQRVQRQSQQLQLPWSLPWLGDWPITHVHDMSLCLSSRVPCQHRTLKQCSTTEQSAQPHSQCQPYVALRTQVLLSEGDRKWHSSLLLTAGPRQTTSRCASAWACPHPSLDGWKPSRHVFAKSLRCTCIDLQLQSFIIHSRDRYL